MNEYAGQWDDDLLRRLKKLEDAAGRKVDTNPDAVGGKPMPPPVLPPPGAKSTGIAPAPDGGTIMDLLAKKRQMGA